jgi:predicted DNA-binding protein YlxM (UPF0122 family)
VKDNINDEINKGENRLKQVEENLKVIEKVFNNNKDRMKKRDV